MLKPPQKCGGLYLSSIAYNYCVRYTGNNYVKGRYYEYIARIRIKFKEEGN